MEVSDIINQPDHEGRTALSLAAMAAHTQIIESIAPKITDWSQKDPDGTPLIHTLILSNLIYVAEVYLTHGGSSSDSDAHGRTCVHVVSSTNDVAAAKMLKRIGGVNFEAVDRGGRTALMTAVWSRHVAISVFLLDCCAVDPNRIDRQGATALSIAAQIGDRDLVNLLLKFGAEPKIKDSMGRTAMDVALISGNDSIVSLLQTANGSSGSSGIGSSVPNSPMDASKQRIRQIRATSSLRSQRIDNNFKNTTSFDVTREECESQRRATVLFIVFCLVRLISNKFEGFIGSKFLKTCSVRATFPGRHFGAALGFPFLTRSLSNSIRVASAPIFLVIIFASTSIAFYPYAKDFAKLSRLIYNAVQRRHYLYNRSMIYTFISIYFYFSTVLVNNEDCFIQLNRMRCITNKDCPQMSTAFPLDATPSKTTTIQRRAFEGRIIQIRHYRELDDILPCKVSTQVRKVSTFSSRPPSYCVPPLPRDLPSTILDLE
ncbi:hypothetical protein GCK72_010302 [Caenorhabditis remanei]|uniref:Uncharacterized protein n=1 Tax=Caenorhabditis remanei TaxID=31234 RepID=A0A6A5H2I2_CAERE|nr:hypothetical protein GCK72_010302 [Caenorhabditis remanei]KAF1762040.1 hypothetical protein GCK72_010302 [Caenorhabditis remanei]